MDHAQHLQSRSRAYPRPGVQAIHQRQRAIGTTAGRGLCLSESAGRHRGAQRRCKCHRGPGQPGVAQATQNSEWRLWRRDHLEHPGGQHRPGDGLFGHGHRRDRFRVRQRGPVKSQRATFPPGGGGKPLLYDHSPHQGLRAVDQRSPRLLEHRQRGCHRHLYQPGARPGGRGLRPATARRDPRRQ